MFWAIERECDGSLQSPHKNSITRILFTCRILTLNTRYQTTPSARPTSSIHHRGLHMQQKTQPTTCAGASPYAASRRMPGRDRKLRIESPRLGFYLQKVQNTVSPPHPTSTSFKLFRRSHSSTVRAFVLIRTARSVQSGALKPVRPAKGSPWVTSESRRNVCP